MTVKDAHRPLAQGDAIEVTYKGRTVEAVVMMASPNGESLIIAFDALLGGHVGTMPISNANQPDACALMDGEPVELRFIHGYDPDNRPTTPEEFARFRIRK